MPLPFNMASIFANKLLAAVLQKEGLKVIPNISWLCGVDAKISFDGWPKDSVIAINSTGINRNKRKKYKWLKMYEQMLCELSPKHILRYGVKIKGEEESISTYYPNENNLMAKQKGNKK